MSPLAAAIVGVLAGLLVAAPLVGRARGLSVATRARDLALPHLPATGSRPCARFLPARLPPGVVDRVARGTLARRRAARTNARTAAEVPLVADLLTVAVGAGCTPFLALEAAARWAPDTAASHLASVLHACSLGVAFGDALAALGRREPVLRPVADALVMCERTGAPVGPVLARLADDARAATRRRAETRARTVPVRLLFPLVFLVLPAFGLLTVAPALLTGFARS